MMSKSATGRPASDPEISVAVYYELYRTEPASENERMEHALMYSVPSALDLNELYGWAAWRAKAKFRGVVAGVLGIMTFWSEDYWEQPENAPAWIARALEQQIANEAMLIKIKAREGGPGALPVVAAQHRGIFWYRFEPVP